MNRKTLVLVLALSVLCLTSSAMIQAASPAIEAKADARGELLPPGPVSDAQPAPDGLFWNANLTYASAQLVVLGPGGRHWEADFSAGQRIHWSARGADGQMAPDGEYRYEIRFGPVLSAQTLATLRAAAERDDRGEVLQGLIASGAIPAEMPVASGTFSIVAGQIIPPSDALEPNGASPSGGASSVPVASSSDRRLAGNVVNDDQIVVGGLCVGVDCADGESFDFVTVRLKENNARIYFEDTSALTGYPTNDWVIEANGPTSENYMGFRDVGTNRLPFLVEAGAPDNALRVADNGHLGLGTAAPVWDIHMLSRDTPTIRMAQDTSGGYNAHTWDIGANESRFFIRDTTAGDMRPFYIRQGAPDKTLALAPEGRVGIGTWSPLYPLDLETANKDALLVARRDLGAQAFLNGGQQQALVGSLSAHPVVLAADYDPVSGAVSATLTLDPSGYLTVTAGVTPTLKLDANGNLTLSGVLTEASDVNRKEGFQAVDGEAVLAKLAGLSITTWSYIGDDPAVRHMGPMSQDFYAAYGLGADDTHLAPLDVDGVTLAALQALQRQNETLRQQNAALEQRLAALEAVVQQLAASEE